jgi:hypothetical protein
MKQIEISAPVFHRFMWATLQDPIRTAGSGPSHIIGHCGRRRTRLETFCVNDYDDRPHSLRYFNIAGPRTDKNSGKPTGHAM